VGGRFAAAFFLAAGLGAGASHASVTAGDGLGALAPMRRSALQLGTEGRRPEVSPGLLPSDWVGRPPVSRPQRTWERRKSARVAMFSSFLVPGLGQLYNEREFWALVASGVETYFIGTMVVEQRLTNRNRALVHAYEVIEREACSVVDDPACAEARRLRQLYAAREVLHRDERIQSTWLLGLTILLSGLQSFVDAHLFDFEAAPPPLRLETTTAGPGAALRVRF
jgi:hypothetical protein